MARRLCPYFQAHSILALIDQPLNLVLRKPETSGHLIKWPGCGASLVLISPTGIPVEYAMQFHFQASNNEAEYEALIASLHLAKELGAASIHVHNDSQLVVNQVTNEYQARESHLTAYVQKVKELLSHFRSHSITQIPSAKNTRADSLARLASASILRSPKTSPLNISLK
ncbi:unnamed protein product [Prunus armeniaca]